jgi:hypothetical protein
MTFRMPSPETPLSSAHVNECSARAAHLTAGQQLEEPTRLRAANRHLSCSPECPGVEAASPATAGGAHRGRYAWWTNGPMKPRITVVTVETGQGTGEPIGFLQN